MGYDLYITRAESWMEKEQSPIPRAAWDAVVSSDPELEVSTKDWYDRQVNDQVERVHSVIWTRHPERVPLWYIDGAIETQNPDKETIMKMVAIAAKLDARVVGEEDEEYGTDGEPRRG